MGPRNWGVLLMGRLIPHGIVHNQGPCQLPKAPVAQAFAQAQSGSSLPLYRWENRPRGGGCPETPMSPRGGLAVGTQWPWPPDL